MFENYNGKKCNCPHCRGGHALESNFQPLEYSSDSEKTIESEINEVNIESLDPNELIKIYIEEVLQSETPEEIEEVMVDFFDEVFLYATQESYITEIEGKILALNLLNGNFEDKDGS